MNKKMNELIERSGIESNKHFQRLIEKTQVLMPTNGGKEVIKNRLTHSYEVMSSAELILTDISHKHGVDEEEIDYKNSLRNASLLHDIGHCPFGHDGSEILDRVFKEKGLKEGFSDNNNNLVVVDKNNIILSPYTKASIVKYPNSLYQDLKDRYSGVIKTCLLNDAEHFEELLNLDLNENNKTTMACQIMDEADENSYVCSDMTDFLVLGNKIPTSYINDYLYNSDFIKSSESIIGHVSSLISVMKSESKTSIKSYFNNVKNDLNRNYRITEDGLTPINNELVQYKRFLKKVEQEFFIKPIKKSEEYAYNKMLFEKYIELVVNEEYYPSKHYKREILKYKGVDHEMYLKMLRNMIAETSDWYVKDVIEKLRIK